MIHTTKLFHKITNSQDIPFRLHVCQHSFEVFIVPLDRHSRRVHGRIIGRVCVIGAWSLECGLPSRSKDICRIAVNTIPHPICIQTGFRFIFHSTFSKYRYFMTTFHLPTKMMYYWATGSVYFLILYAMLYRTPWVTCLLVASFSTWSTYIDFR